MNQLLGSTWALGNKDLALPGEQPLNGGAVLFAGAASEAALGQSAAFSDQQGAIYRRGVMALGREEQLWEEVSLCFCSGLRASQNPLLQY